MSVFRFKRFEVINERSAMKVNTDGVLLGASAIVYPTDKYILDIGTGTGTVALMLAQRYSDMNAEVSIEGIDIDRPSVEEAATNFAQSPWSGRLVSREVSLLDFEPERKYDLIVSNPPYFDDSLKNPDERKSAARHTGLSYREIILFATKWLSEKGRLSMILPSDQKAAVLRYARSWGLSPEDIMLIRTVPTKQHSRMVLTLCHGRNNVGTERELTIMKEGKHTDEYISLLNEFYLFM